MAVHGAWGNFYGTPVVSFLDDGPPRGHRVLSMNSRGHDLGSLGDSEPCIGFMRDRFIDAPADLDAAAAVARGDAALSYALVAHSWACHRSTAWLEQGPEHEPEALVFLSPAPHLREAEKWFVDGSLDVYLARAAAAVADGRPEQLVVLSSGAQVPMVAEAATVLDTWGSDYHLASRDRLSHIDLPLLVLCGAREPEVYRDFAESFADAAPRAEFVLLDDTHYYELDRSAMTGTVLDWLDDHGPRKTGGIP